jgi:predicted ATPase/DNA-binding XRE family transcriptional regulator
MEDRAFGELLRAFRIQAELSQETLAEKARVSAAAISALERNVRRGPQQQTLELISDALGLPPEKRAQLERAARDGRRRKVRPFTADTVGITARATNVPYALTSFHGRDAELADLDRLLPRRRLIALVGPGGVGKTRLAIESAHRQLDVARFPDGVWFVDLAPTADVDSIASAIARTLAIPEIGGAATLDVVRAALAPKRSLLVLDNCEHVLEAGAIVVEAILREARSVAIVVTTREALRAEGECVVHVNPLPIDAGGGASPAVALLADRLADANYTAYARITAEHAAVAATICCRLDGLPLALELAAARAGQLSLEQIGSSLDERFALLSNGRRTAVARQSTLYNTIGWSYDLLAVEDRLLFARLGVFAGAFAPDVAVDVCGAGLARARDALETLAAKSLVSVVASGRNDVRYRLLESTRAFALERLRVAGEADRYARRFADVFGALARTADSRFGRMPKSEFIAGVEPDLDNYRAALDWTLAQENDIYGGAELAGSMGWIFRQLSMFKEGARWSQRALIHAPALDARVVGRLHMAMSYYSFALGPMQAALESAMAATAAYRRIGAASELAWSLTQEAYCAYRLGSSDAVRVASEEAVRIARAGRDVYRLAAALNAYALTIPPERAAERLTVLEESIACSRACGSHDAIVPTAHLAAAYYEAGALEKAVACGRDTVAMARQSRDLSTLAAALGNYAVYAFGVDDESAEAAAYEALELVRDLGKTMMAMCALQLLGTAAARNGRPMRAARLLGASSALYRDFGYAREATEQQLYDETAARIRSEIGDHAFARHLHDGMSLGIAAAIAEGLAVEPTRRATHTSKPHN